jgi:hypothetical protein
MTLKVEEEFTTEISETLPTLTRYNNPKTELTSIINHHGNLKSTAQIQT